MPRYTAHCRYDLYRPVNLLPLDRAVVNTQFFLRTRWDQNSCSFIASR